MEQSLDETGPSSGARGSGELATSSSLDPTFRALFDGEFSYVCRTLRRCGVRAADVEDRAHDVFLVAHLRFCDFDPTRPVKPWLFGIAFRVASQHTRRASYRREEATADIDPPDAAAGPLELLQMEDRRRLLHEALDALDEDRRAVLVMHDLDDFPVQEIARTLGIPLFTAYSRLRTARRDLAEAVKRLRARAHRGGR